MHAKSERELLAVGAEHQLAHPFEELVAIDRAVAVPVEGSEHAPREVLAAQAERLLEMRNVDPGVRVGVLAKGAVERGQQTRVERRDAG